MIVTGLSQNTRASIIKRGQTMFFIHTNWKSRTFICNSRIDKLLLLTMFYIV